MTSSILYAVEKTWIKIFKSENSLPSRFTYNVMKNYGPHPPRHKDLYCSFMQSDRKVETYASFTIKKRYKVDWHYSNTSKSSLRNPINIVQSKDSSSSFSDCG